MHRNQLRARTEASFPIDGTIDDEWNNWTDYERAKYGQNKSNFFNEKTTENLTGKEDPNKNDTNIKDETESQPEKAQKEIFEDNKLFTFEFSDSENETDLTDPVKAKPDLKKAEKQEFNDLFF
eukprot:Pgem_evm1s9109